MNKKINVWKKNNLLKQCLTVLFIIVACVAAVFVIDVLSNPGRSWSDSLVIRMIFERRAQD